jgi:ubiquinone/menaquinone biosynthesis C-methylase UbiE
MDLKIEAMQNARLASWGKVNRARLAAVLRHSGSTVLDVGCSTGLYVDDLNRRGFFACGLDLLVDPAWKERLRNTFTTGEATWLPFPAESFDTVIAFEVLEHVPGPERALQEFHRVCRRNVILSVPDCAEPEHLLRAGLAYAHWRDRTHCNFFTRQSLGQALARNGFRVESLRGINYILPDYPALRSFAIPSGLAYFAARLLRRIPFRRQYPMTLLAIAGKI